MSNPVFVSKTGVPANNFHCGHQSANASTPAPLSPVAWPVQSQVVITADTGNSGYLSIGPATDIVNAGGYRLYAGQSVTLKIDNLSSIYVLGSTSGLGYSWVSL